MTSGEVQQKCTIVFISCTFRYPMRWFSQKNKQKSSVFQSTLREVRDGRYSKTKRLKPAAITQTHQTHQVYDQLVLFGTPGNDIERHIPLVVCEIPQISVYQEGLSTSFSTGSWLTFTTFIFILGRTIPPIKNVALVLSGCETSVKMVRKKSLVEVRGTK